MSDHITSELARAHANLDLPARSWLRQQGISNQTMLTYPGPIGVAEIEVYDLDIFDFADAGQPAYVHPVYSGGIDSEPIDIVAWMPSDPSRWWTNMRTGWPLGDDALHYAEFWSEPVLLQSSPLKWLASGGDGVCVLDLPRSDQDPGSLSEVALRSLPLIICEDADHGHAVQQALTAPIPTCPEVRVMARSSGI